MRQASAPRRRFLVAAFAGACALRPTVGLALPAADERAWRALRFDNLHTGEKLTAEYVQAGRYVPDALAAINHLLRDFRTGDVGPIDTALLDLIDELHRLTGSRRAFEVISGYRSPHTNAALQRRSSGVATDSLHMRGQAIDLRLGDVALDGLRDAALSLRGGGVGFYPASSFVHVDCGRVRAW